MKRAHGIAGLVSLLLLALVAVPAAFGQAADHGDHGAAPVATSSGDALEKLVGQIRVAITHATFSLDQNQLGPRQTHAHHVVNILQGAAGPNFDASKGNPGDGHGALNYAAEAVRTDVTRKWAENTSLYLDWATAEAIAATQTSDFEVAGVAIQRSLAYLSAALGRTDDQGALGSALAWQAAAADVVTIDITNFAYGDGQDLVIAKGTTVVWVNRDDAPHTVTGPPLVSPVMNKGDVFTYTFDEAGTFDYICAFHPNMKHRIIVH